VEEIWLIPLVDHVPGRTCIGTINVPSPSCASGCGATVTVLLTVWTTVESGVATDANAEVEGAVVAAGFVAG
jgi:hypothetical protein